MMQSSITKKCWICGHTESLNQLTLNEVMDEYECAETATCRNNLNWRCSQLMRIAIDLHWMARRYADGRCTYAPGMVNNAVRTLLMFGAELNISGDQTPWARDGMGPGYSGLSKEEYELGLPIEEWSKIVIPEEMAAMAKEIEELKKYKFMYEGLCK
jgi:hypothetical protein